MFPYRCPELNACISAELWCDGAWHCPSGYDEEEANCAFQFGVPILYVSIGAGALLALTLLILVTACVKYRQHRRSREKKKAARSNNHLHITQLHNNGDALGKRYPGSPEDLYLDGKDSLCWQNVLAIETTVWPQPRPRSLASVMPDLVNDERRRRGGFP